MLGLTFFYGDPFKLVLVKITWNVFTSWTNELMIDYPTKNYQPKLDWQNVIIMTWHISAFHSINLFIFYVKMIVINLKENFRITMKVILKYYL